MRQLITRIDEALHQQLKRRAAAEGRSINALVTDLLRAAVERAGAKAQVRARLASGALRVIPPLTRRPPSREAAIRATRGVGDAASRALAADREFR